MTSTTHRLPTNTTGPCVPKKKQSTSECDSAIGQHLLKNDQCAANYNEDQFSILDTARSRFRRTMLEASYIRVRRPNLCKQKEFVYTQFVQVDFRRWRRVQ